MQSTEGIVDRINKNRDHYCPIINYGIKNGLKLNPEDFLGYRDSDLIAPHGSSVIVRDMLSNLVVALKTSFPDLTLRLYVEHPSTCAVHGCPGGLCGFWMFKIGIWCRSCDWGNATNIDSCEWCCEPLINRYQ